MISDLHDHSQIKVSVLVVQDTKPVKDACRLVSALVDDALLVKLVIHLLSVGQDAWCFVAELIQQNASLVGIKAVTDITPIQWLAGMRASTMEEFHKRFREMLCSHVQRMFSLDVDDADDIVGDLFVHLLVSDGHTLKQFRGGNFRRWLLRVAENFAKNVLRRRGRMILESELGGEEFRRMIEGKLRVQGRPVEEAIIRAETTRVIEYACTQLPDGMHQIIMLWLSGRSVSEIAEQLDIPCGTVQSRLHPAKITLRDRIMNSLMGGERDDG